MDTDGEIREISLTIVFLMIIPRGLRTVNTLPLLPLGMGTMKST